MLKKRIALLLTVIMVTTSLYPGEFALAEDAVVTENATEAVTEDRDSAEIIADEEFLPVDDSALEGDSTPEELIGEDGDFGVDMVSVEAIDPMLESETEMDDISVEIQDSAELFALQEENTSNAMTFSGALLKADDSYDALSFREGLLDVQTEISYIDSNGAISSETADSWEEILYGEEGCKALGCITENGNEINLILQKSGQLIDMPFDEDYRIYYTGSFTLTLLVDGLECDSKDITVELSGDVRTLRTGEEEEYSLLDGEGAWYGFETEDEAEYIVDLSGVEAMSVAYMVLKNTDGLLERMDIEDGGFTSEAEAKYLIHVGAVGTPLAEGVICVRKKRAIASVSFTVQDTYNVMTAYRDLQGIQTTVNYQDGSQELLDGWTDRWDYTDDKTGRSRRALSCLTGNGDWAYLTLWCGGKLVDMPTSESIAPVDVKCSLKLIVGEQEETRPVLFMIPTDTVLSNTFAIAVGESCYYTIPEQEADMILTVNMSSEESDTDGNAIISAMICREDGGNMILESYSDIYAGKNSLFLAAQQRYWVILSNDSGYSVTGSIHMSMQKEIHSVMGFELGKACSTEDALEFLEATVPLVVKYTDNTRETISGWDEGYYEDDDGDVWSCLEAVTENGNSVQLRLEKDGTYVDLPYEGSLESGDYMAAVYVDGEEQENCSVSFIVAEPLELGGSEHTVSLLEGESQWFEFIPPEDGEYTIYASSDSEDSYVELYTLYDPYGDLEYLDENDDGADLCNFSLTCEMEALSSYYYKVYGYDYEPADFTVTIVRKPELVGTRPGQQPDETEFVQAQDKDDDYIYIDLTMMYLYGDGTEYEVCPNDNDKFNNRLRVMMYPVDASGEADMTSGNLLSAYCKPGKYLVIAEACYYDPDEGDYIPYEGESYEQMQAYITIVEPPHEHSYEWITTPASCTTDGVKTYKCSICGEVQSTETIRAAGHVWGTWVTVSAATVSAPERQEHQCSVCGAKEERTVGNPLPVTSGVDVGNPKLEVPANSIKMQNGQSTTAFTVTMSEGDSIASVTSSNTKLLKVSNIDRTKGTFKLKAQKKKTGRVKLTITLASGETKTVTVNVQKKKVTTKKVKLNERKLTLEEGDEYTLKPVLKPITTQDKVRFLSSNSGIATVTSKGVIKAKKSGKVTITVACGRKKAKCQLTVTK